MNTLKCPICKSNLFISGKARLQTLDEHVFDPNGEVSLKDVYSCVSLECDSHAFEVVWSKDGEMYARKFIPSPIFINNNSAPFGTLMRKINVEIYKNDENLHLRFSKYHLELVWKYKADFDGNVLSKRPTFKLWINNILYVSGISMFVYSIKLHYWRLRSADEKRSDFDYPKYDYEKKDWWRWAVPFVLRIADYKTYKGV